MRPIEMLPGSKFIVYKDPHEGEPKTRKGPRVTLSQGFVWCPYIPNIPTPVIVAEEKVRPEFKSFTDIKRLKNDLNITITEKIHGSNAQLYVYVDEEDEGKLKLLAGSRTRWLDPGVSDNYGFGAWAAANAGELIAWLGHGRHYGEWYGAGINHGYGLKEKRLALFNTNRWQQVVEGGRALPARVDLVPVLYQGPFRETVVDECLMRLKREGSVLVPGCTKPEGVVVYFHDVDIMRKSVIDPEETGWRGKGPDGEVKAKVAGMKNEELFALVADHLQSVRLEKLMSRDSQYMEQYPSSLPNIVKDYLTDLDKECPPPDEMRKALGKAMFPWVKSILEKPNA